MRDDGKKKYEIQRDHVKISFITCINSYVFFLVGKIKYSSSSKKKFFSPELFGSSQLHGFTGKWVQARKKTGILKFYSENPYFLPVFP